MIRPCNHHDVDSIWAIINDGARAYKGIIPDDRWTEPYMSRAHLQQQIEEGVEFWAYEDGRVIQGVMGLQPIQNVVLIRHAYVRTESQHRGIGASLLSHLRTLTTIPMLVGTWADAVWAIRFYERHGFHMVSPQEKDQLLKQYWTIPDRQVETSVVLVDGKWQAAQPMPINKDACRANSE